MLFYLQCTVFLVLLCFALFLLISDPISDNGDYYKPWSIINQWKETNFIVPETARKPAVSIQEFYQKQDDLIWEMILKSRLEFKEQHFVGSVMKDGFHSDLPADCMWKNGKIEKNKTIYNLRKAETEKGSAPQISKINSTTQ